MYVYVDYMEVNINLFRVNINYKYVFYNLLSNYVLLMDFLIIILKLEFVL